MKRNLILPMILLLVGLAFVLGSLFSAFDNLTATEPVGLGKWVFDVLQFITGAGSGIVGWMNLIKSTSDNSVRSTRTQEVLNSPDSEQTMQGQGGTQKQKSVDSPRSKQTMK